MVDQSNWINESLPGKHNQYKEKFICIEGFYIHLDHIYQRQLKHK